MPAFRQLALALALLGGAHAHAAIDQYVPVAERGVIANQYIVQLDLALLRQLNGALPVGELVNGLLARVPGAELLHVYSRALPGLSLRMTPAQARVLSLLPGIGTVHDLKRAYDLGAKAWLGSVALDSAAMDVEQIMQGTHARFYDQAFGASPAYWAATSPLRQLDKTATPLLAVCSSQRSDACPAAQKFVAAASRLGVNAQLLSQDRSHKAINQDLGADNAYTREVERFMATLDSKVAQQLGLGR